MRYVWRFRQTRIVLTFSEPLRSATGRNVRNYRVVAPGPDRRFGTRDDRTIRLRTARYQPSSDFVTLIPRRRLPRALRLRIIVDGRGAPGVTDAAGLLLDGNDDGRPGGRFTAL